MKITASNGIVTFGHGEGSFSVVFHRTLRLPEDGKTHALPPSLGTLPVHLVDDFKDRVPQSWVEHGGIFLPLHEREAMWLGFQNHRLPCAVKVAAGKVNAVNGKPWSAELVAGVEDYMVAPPQPWLDGFNSGTGTIRQFVAMAMGKGYTVEAQVTGKEEHGGIQLLVIPPKAGAIKPSAGNILRTAGFVAEETSLMGGPVHSVYSMQNADQAFDSHCSLGDPVMRSMSLGTSKSLSAPVTRARTTKAAQMGLGAGGSMQQKIYPDPYGVEVWDQAAAGRLFVHIINAEMYQEITGHAPPPMPQSAQSYQGPWFGMDDANQSDIAAPEVLQKVLTVGQKDAQHGFEGQQDDSPVSETVTTTYPVQSPGRSFATGSGDALPVVARAPEPPRAAAERGDAVRPERLGEALRRPLQVSYMRGEAGAKREAPRTDPHRRTLPQVVLRSNLAQVRSVIGGRMRPLNVHLLDHERVPSVGPRRTSPVALGRATWNRWRPLDHGTRSSSDRRGNVFASELGESLVALRLIARPTGGREVVQRMRAAA